MLMGHQVYRLYLIVSCHHLKFSLPYLKISPLCDKSNEKDDLVKMLAILARAYAVSNKHWTCGVVSLINLTVGCGCFFCQMFLLFLTSSMCISDH